MANLKNLASQTAIYGLSTIVGRFLNVMLVPLYTRIFTQAEFGIQVEYYAYISFLNILLTHGMETAFFRYADKDNLQQVYATAFLSVAAVSGIFAVTILLFSKHLASAMGYGHITRFIWFSAGILVADALCAIPFALLRHQNKAIRFAIIKNINIAVNIGANLYLLVLAPYVKSTYGITLPFYTPNLGVHLIFVSNLLASAVTLLLLLPQLLYVGKYYNYATWQALLKYALPMVLVGFAGMINETLDRLMLKHFASTTNEANVLNGIYGATYKFSIIITVFIQAFKYAAEPFFFAHAKTTDKRDLYARVMDYFILVCLAIFLMVTLFMDVFKIYLGNKFHEGLHIVPILLLANICLGIYYNLSVWYKLSDKTGKGAKISLIGAAITIVLNYILIPKISYTGCAIATLVCYATMMVISYVWGNKYYPIPYNVSKIGMYTLLALGLFGINYFWLEPTLANAYIKHAICLLMLVTFVAFAWLKEQPLKHVK